MELEDMKHVVHLLHMALHLPEHHLLKERQLLERMDNLKQQLSPLEKVERMCVPTSVYDEMNCPNTHHSICLALTQMKAQLSKTAETQSSKVIWTGLALLSVQGGALAWLTWWVYSWDVMEPVTYFITYATSMGAFAYYVLTKQVCLSQKQKNYLTINLTVVR